MPFGPGLVLRGASERLSPILMTALATALALVPLVLGGNRPGQEIEYPMAIVILGGLATSTLLNLFVLPVLYLSVGRSLPRPRPDQAPGDNPGLRAPAGSGWRLVVQAAADEVLDDGVGVVGGRPGHADLARADAGDGPVGDAGACVVAAGGFGDQGDAVAVGDRGQVMACADRYGSDADRVTLAFGVVRW